MNKDSESDESLAELFQILKDDAVKVLHTKYTNKFGKLSSGHRTRKTQFSFQSQRMFKLPHNCTHFTCKQRNAQNYPSEASIVCEPRTSRCSSLFQKRQRNQRSNCQHLLFDKKQKNSRKVSTSTSLTTLKPLTVWVTTNYGRLFKRWEYQTT